MNKKKLSVGEKFTLAASYIEQDMGALENSRHLITTLQQMTFLPPEPHDLMARFQVSNRIAVVQTAYHSIELMEEALAEIKEFLKKEKEQINFVGGRSDFFDSMVAAFQKEQEKKRRREDA